MASELADYIIGTVLEVVDIEAAVSKYGNDIWERAYNEDTANSPTVDDIAKELCAKLQDEGVTMNTFAVEDIYTKSAQSQYNQNVWSDSPTPADGRKSVGRVSALGLPRIHTYLITLSPEGSGTPYLERILHRCSGGRFRTHDLSKEVFDKTTYQP